MSSGPRPASGDFAAPDVALRLRPTRLEAALDFQILRQVSLYQRRELQLIAGEFYPARPAGIGVQGSAARNFEAALGNTGLHAVIDLLQANILGVDCQLLDREIDVLTGAAAAVTTASPPRGNASPR